jgi:hypothetical protein
MSREPENKDIRRIYMNTTYWLRFNWQTSEWCLKADGTHIGGPYSTKEQALTALDAVAPPK